MPPSTRALIDRCWQAGGAIFLSAVTAWEIEFGCPLVTYDERIARFGAKHGPQYEFAVEVR